MQVSPPRVAFPTAERAPEGDFLMEQGAAGPLRLTRRQFGPAEISILDYMPDEHGLKCGGKDEVTGVYLWSPNRSVRKGRSEFWEEGSWGSPQPFAETPS